MAKRSEGKRTYEGEVNNRRQGEEEKGKRRKEKKDNGRDTIHGVSGKGAQGTWIHRILW